MWKRINYDAWVDLVPIIAFVLTFTVFVVLVARTFLLKKADLDTIAQLPLDDSSPALKGRNTIAKGKAGTAAALDPDPSITAP